MADSRKQAGAQKQEQNRDVLAPDAKAALADPLVGRVLNGRFKVLSMIARGGMGKVYKAEQAPLGRLCALKVLNPKYDGERDPEFHRRFFLEAATAAKLHHPNTVTVYDYGKSDEDELYYIAMEYIEGRTLHRAIRDDGPFDEARACHIARQICRSLREAHRMGVVHRDLKPGNVLLIDHGDEPDSVKVLDFGLVKDVSGAATDEDLTQAGLFMGSPKYMAPEQIVGPEVSACTDIYALGVVLYEMLCGKVPFDRGAAMATLMAQVHEQPPPMTTHKPDLAISDVMHEIVRRCLEKEVAKRFANMDEVLAALKQSEGLRISSHSADWSGPHRVSGIRGAPGPLSPQAFSPQDTDSSIARRSSNPIVPQAPPVTPAPGVTALGQAAPADSGFGVRSGVAAAAARPSPQDSSSPPSITDTLGAAQAPVPPDLEIPPFRPRRGRYPWIIAAVVAVGLGGVTVFLSTSKSPSPQPAGEAAVAPAAQPQEPSPAPSAQAAPAALVEHKVRIETDPAGASVTEGEKIVCEKTPCEMTFPAGTETRTISVEKQGFEKEVLTVKATEETVKAKLNVLPLKPTPRSVPVQTPATKQGSNPPPSTGGAKDYKDDPYKKNPY